MPRVWLLVPLLANIMVAVTVAENQVVFYPGQSTLHQTGFQVGTAWAASVDNKTNAYLTYGPYYQPPSLVRAGLCLRCRADAWACSKLTLRTPSCPQRAFSTAHEAL